MTQRPPDIAARVLLGLPDSYTPALAEVEFPGVPGAEFDCEAEESGRRWGGRALASGWRVTPA